MTLKLIDKFAFIGNLHNFFLSYFSVLTTGPCLSSVIRIVAVANKLANCSGNVRYPFDIQYDVAVV